MVKQTVLKSLTLLYIVQLLILSEDLFPRYHTSSWLGAAQGQIHPYLRCQNIPIMRTMKILLHNWLIHTMF
jgi:hypothetical protein